MLGNSSENSFWPKKKIPALKFDEGKHLDMGEIDPLTGERVVLDPKIFDKKPTEKPKSFIKIEDQKTNVCKFCKSDPCTADCDYR